MDTTNAIAKVTVSQKVRARRRKMHTKQLEKAVNDTKVQYEDKIKELKDKIKNYEDEIDHLKQRNNDQQEKNWNLHDKVSQMEGRTAKKIHKTYPIIEDMDKRNDYNNKKYRYNKDDKKIYRSKK